MFGRRLRCMHFFGASSMVLLIGIHAIRTFLMAAYKFPREMSWISGVFLLAFTLLLGFTGELLHFDQNAVSSVAVAAEQAGRVPFIGTIIAHFLLRGDVVGGATLSRFLAVHVFLIPALIFAFVGLQRYLVLRNGTSDPPGRSQIADKDARERYHAMLKREGEPFFPNAAWRDALFGLLVIAVIFALALIFGPPELIKPPDPTIVDTYPRPDWYILCYYAVLAMLPHGSEAYVIILFPLFLGLFLLLLPLLAPFGERSPLRRPWAVGAVLCTVVGILPLSFEGKNAPWSPDFKVRPLQIANASAPVAEGARLFYEKGCKYCHRIEPQGRQRGSDLSTVARRLTRDQMIIRINNGGYNMPAFAGSLTPEQLDRIVAFLESRK